jgi:hypothetical protein
MVLIVRQFYFLALSVLLLVPFVLQAQFKIPINIGCLGMNGSTITQFSGPVVIDNKSCFSIKNGVNDFAIKKNDLFNLKCKIDSLRLSSVIRFVCIPNPVMTICNIKLQNQISTDNSPVVLVLIGNDGRVYENSTTTLKQLSSVYLMNLSSMSSGVYTLKLLFDYQIISTIKIIKA